VKDGRIWGYSHYDTVDPGKDGKLVYSSNQVPSSSDVAGYKDGEGQDGKGVHKG
jgi:hypothetical protein